MYRLKTSGIGKKWCGDEIIFLSETLSQRKLKKLFNAKCEFVYYEQQETTSEETEKSRSTATEENKDISNGSGGRKANRRKTNKVRKAD